MSRRDVFHLRLGLALLAWLAQLCLPVAHASMMSGMATGTSSAWCGEPARMARAMAELPPEIRQALELDGSGGPMADHLNGCAKLCSISGTAVPPPAAATPHPARNASIELVVAVAPAPGARAQSPTPPAQAPPLRAG